MPQILGCLVGNPTVLWHVGLVIFVGKIGIRVSALVIIHIVYTISDRPSNDDHWTITSGISVHSSYLNIEDLWGNIHYKGMEGRCWQSNAQIFYFLLERIYLGIHHMIKCTNLIKSTRFRGVFRDFTGVSLGVVVLHHALYKVLGHVMQDIR